MRTSTRIATLVMFACVCGGAVADVYKWVGADGRVHFGDRPPADAQAEEVRIPTFTGAAEVADEGAANAGGGVLLTTTWCGVCKLAKQHLAAKGVPYTELDVEKSDAGRAEYKRLNGRGVPIILVGKQRMNGFTASQLDKLLRQAGL